MFVKYCLQLTSIKIKVFSLLSAKEEKRRFSTLAKYLPYGREDL